MAKKYGDVEVSDVGGFVALLEIQRGPNYFLDQALIASIADALDDLDKDAGVRGRISAVHQTGLNAVSAGPKRVIRSIGKPCACSETKSR
jgi:enoyl-CoA hydratase/carnithine racemase